MGCSICTWNVNGLRSRKNIGEVFRTVAADVFCIQETKISRDQIDENLACINNTYDSCFAIPRQVGFKGRSGCATYYLKTARPCNVELGLLDEQTCPDAWKIRCTELKDFDIQELDSEGRVVITCHDIKIASPDEGLDQEKRKLYLMNIYFPRLDPEKEERVVFKDKFNKLVEHKVNHILQDPLSHVIIACDLNIEHRQIDSCELQEDFDSDFYRQWLTQFLSPKENTKERYMVDSFRMLYPNLKWAYTCWCHQIVSARESNYGTRIDLIMIDSELAKFTKDVVHLTKIFGSDHCPVMITLDKVKLLPSKDNPPGSIRTWPEFKKRQTSLKNFFTVLHRPKSQNEEVDIDEASSNSDCRKKLKGSPEFEIIRDESTQSSNNEFVVDKRNPVSKPLTAYEKIMQRKPPIRPSYKPIHCPTHGVVCDPKACEKKGVNFKRIFFACSKPKCKFFRWAPKPQ